MGIDLGGLKMILEDVRNYLSKVFKKGVNYDELAISITKLIEENFGKNIVNVFRDTQDSLVFDMGNEVVKITALQKKENISFYEYFKGSSFILKPNFEIVYHTGIKNLFNKEIFITVLGQKKLDSKSVGYEDLARLYCNLRDEGYVWNDVKIQNIGKDGDKVFLFDYGDVFNRNYEKNYLEKLNFNANAYPVYNEIYDKVLMIRKKVFDEEKRERMVNNYLKKEGKKLENYFQKLERKRGRLKF